MNACYISSLVLVLGLVPTFSNAQQLHESAETRETVRMIRGLKERRLFDLAQKYAAERLRSESIDRPGQVAIVLEQMRTGVAEAVQRQPDDRESSWRATLQFAEEFLTSDPDHPRRILVEVQIGLTHLSRGRLAQQEIAAEIVPGSMQPSALEAFRAAEKKFREVERRIDRMLPELQNANTDDGQFSQKQLANLANNVRFQQAIANLARAQLYTEDDRLNRIDAINRVLTQLDQVLQRSDAEYPLWWQAQIARAGAMRLLGKPVDASGLLDRLPDADLSNELQAELLTERLELELLSPRVDATLQQAAAEFENATPVLQLARLKLLMKQANSGEGESRSRLLANANSLVSQIESDHGRYWGRRAEVILVGSVEASGVSGSNSGELEILIRRGDAAWRKQQVTDAVAAYEKAARLAGAGDDNQLTLRVTVRLAQALESIDQHQRAATTLIAAAEKFESDGQAAAIFLRGCWNLAKAAEADQQLQAQLVKRLEQLISHWPSTKESNTARLWLGNAHQKLGQHRSAIETWLQLPVESVVFDTAVTSIAATARHWIRKSGASEKPAVRQQIAQLLSVRWKEEGASGTMSPGSISLLLTTIEFAMPEKLIEPMEAMRALDQALEDSKWADSKFKQVIQAWRWVARAVVVSGRATPDLQTLEQQLKQLPNDPELMEICLDGLRANLSAEAERKLAALIVILCDKALVNLSTPRPESATMWVLAKADAEIDLGRFETAVRSLEQLADYQPESLEVQLAYSRGLTMLPDQARAIAQWRRLTRKLKPGTEPWLEAKYNIARLLSESDRPAEALKLLEYISAIPPGWSGSAWSEEFEQLQNELSQR